MHCLLLGQLSWSLAFLVTFSYEESPFIVENADSARALQQMKDHFNKKREEVKKAIEKGYKKGKTESIAGHLQMYRNARTNCTTDCQPLKEKLVEDIKTSGTTTTYVLLRECRLLCYKSTMYPIAKRISKHPSNMAHKILSTLGIDLSEWAAEEDEAVVGTVTVDPEKVKILAGQMGLNSRRQRSEEELRTNFIE